MDTSVLGSPEDVLSDEEIERSLAKNRKKKLALKLRKLKLRQTLNQHRAYSSPGYNIGAVYELKINKVRRNNKDLAKALADQKIDTQHWYNEVISLRGELQESHERLLRSNDKNNEVLIEREVERRIKEIGEPLNTAISQAMENLLVVVENFSKVKQLANVRNHSRTLSTSSFSFPRSSGSRAPLGSCGNNTGSPCRTVLPMVSGHVLQPAMVAIQKLDDVWKAKVKERIQAREGEALDMTTIGEQSVSSVVLEDINDTSSSPQGDRLATTDPSSSEDPANNTLEELTFESVTPRSPNTSSRARRGRLIGGGSRASMQSPVSVQSTSPTVAVSPLSKSNDEKNNTTSLPSLEPDDDPLEGASWWYSDPESSLRGRGRGRGRGGGRKRGKPKSSVGLSSSPGHLKRSSMEASSESEDDDPQRNKSKTHSPVENKSKVNKTLALPDSPAPALERSYLASPATMLTRLENLEAKSGRRSKSKSKGRSLRMSGAIIDNVNKQQTDAIMESNENCPSDTNDAYTLALSDAGTASNSHAPEDDHQFKKPLFPPPKIRPSKFDDFLIRDTDLTCIGDVSMEMTEPVSKILSQAAAELKNKETKEMHKPVNNEKKFFKNQSTGNSQKPPNQEKTLFDLSMMDATYMAIPPYSSLETVEKENMPPQSDNANDNKEKEEEEENNEKENAVNLRRVSIVLKDVMKSTETDNLTPEVNLTSPAKVLNSPPSAKHKNSDKEIKPSLETNKKRGSSRKRCLKTFSLYAVLDDDDEENDDDDDEEDTWSPEKPKKKKSGESRVSFQKQKRCSSVVKKRDTCTASPLSPPTNKKERKRKNKNEVENPLNVILDDEQNKGPVNKKSDEKDFIGFNPMPDKGLSDCYVKICRTPIKDVRKSSTPIDDSCVEIDHDDSFSMLYDNDRHSLASRIRKNKKETRVAINSDPTDRVHVIGGIAEHSEALESGEVTSDQVVPDQEDEAAAGEVAGGSMGKKKKSETIMAAELGDCHVDMSTARESVCSHKNEPSNEVVAETEAPRRKRGAALKVTSFKEPSLNAKMRQERQSLPTTTKAKPDRKSGRKSVAC